MLFPGSAPLAGLPISAQLVEELLGHVQFAEILHEPRLWPEYGPGYYAVFIRDPAGNNLELKCQADVAG